MKDLEQDDTHDLDLDSNSGSFSMLDSKQELEQKIVNAVSTNQNELDWNSRIGLSQLNLVYNGNSQRSVENILTEYLQRIFGRQQVVSVKVYDLQYDDDSRTLTFDSQITLNIQGELLKLQPAFNLGGDNVDGYEQ